MVNAINGFSDIEKPLMGVRERGNHVRNGKGQALAHDILDADAPRRGKKSRTPKVRQERQ